MPSTKVIKTTTTGRNKDGSKREQVQYRITVPRKIAEEYELEGGKFEWSVKSRDRFELMRV